MVSENFPVLLTIVKGVIYYPTCTAIAGEKSYLLIQADQQLSDIMASDPHPLVQRSCMRGLQDEDEGLKTSSLFLYRREISAPPGEQ